MKKVSSVLICLFLILLIFSHAGFTKDVTVSGTVKAAATNEPINEASVALFGGTLDMSTIPDSIDTVFTGSDGTFEATITVPENANILFYGAHKEGYLAKTDIKQYLLTPMPTEIDVGDILLKTIDDAKDTLRVSGTVVDSITQEPLSDVKIRVTSGLIGDITIDSLTSDAQGKFDGKIPYIPGTNPLFKAIFYSAEKDGYIPKGDTAGIPDNEIIDLGTIELVEENIAIKYPIQKFKMQQPTHIAVYSMNGKLIYEGPFNHQKVFDILNTANQQVLIRYYRNNKLLGVIKDLQLK
jgi:hypothetical protein